MKKAFTLFIILGLIASLSIWAENNVKDEEANIKPKWGKIKSEDHSAEGALTTKAEIEVDIDYPDEPGIQLRDGIEYEAYARGSAGFQWGSHGMVDIDTTASRETRDVRETYSTWVWKSRRSKHFRKYSGAAAEGLNNYDEDDVKRHLRYTRARASITREFNNDDYYNRNYESVATANTSADE